MVQILFLLSQVISKKFCFRWPEKKKDREAFNDLNTQQQCHKLELDKIKLLFFGLLYISWNHAWPASHDLGDTKNLSI